MDKFQAEAKYCKGGKDCKETNIAGTWSTIYDQAFKVELENGMRFLANFKYSVKPQISQDPTNDGAEEFISLKTGDYNKFNSQCDKTMVGFVQDIPKITKSNHTMAQHKVQCFWAEQETHYDMEKTVSVKTESDTVKVAVITSENKIVTDDQPTTSLTENMDVQLGEELLSQVDSESEVQSTSLAQ